MIERLVGWLRERWPRLVLPGGILVASLLGIIGPCANDDTRPDELAISINLPTNTSLLVGVATPIPVTVVWPDDNMFAGVVEIKVNGHPHYRTTFTYDSDQARPTFAFEYAAQTAGLTTIVVTVTESDGARRSAKDTATYPAVAAHANETATSG